MVCSFHRLEHEINLDPTERSNVIDVTTQAVEKLKTILEEEKATDSALRVVVVPAGHGVQYMLTLDNEARTDDIVTEIDGIKVLIDADSGPLMEGASIDYVEDLMRSGFIVSNPNISAGGCGGGGGGCGCGGGGCGCGGSCSCGASG